MPFVGVVVDGKQRDPGDHIPLKHSVYRVLLVLATGEMHGYGVMKEIDRQTDGSMKPATGALYLAAKRLVGTGLIEESDERPDPELDDRRRRYYRLTDYGREVAAAETGRLASLVKVARAKGLGG